MKEWLFAALFFPALQVAPCYLWPHLPRSRTIYRRIAATTAAALAAGWLPTAHVLAARDGDGQGQPSLMAALGLRVPGLAAACALPLALTALLFAGPLLQLALLSAGTTAPRASPWRQRLALPPAERARNWVAAPLVEEFIFRSCLVSFLLASGASRAAIAWLSPLLFAASHLHHLWDLTRHQRFPLRAALAAVVFQLSYTALFGWLAAHYFLRARHLAAAALPHMFCNFIGPPTPRPAGMPRQQRRAVGAAYVAGVAAFFCLLGPLTQPKLYAAGPFQEWNATRV